MKFGDWVLFEKSKDHPSGGCLLPGIAIILPWKEPLFQKNAVKCKKTVVSIVINIERRHWYDMRDKNKTESLIKQHHVSIRPEPWSLMMPRLRTWFRKCLLAWWRKTSWCLVTMPAKSGLFLIIIIVPCCIIIIIICQDPIIFLHPPPNGDAWEVGHVLYLWLG